MTIDPIENEGPLSLLLTTRKKSTVSQEQFLDYWSSVHGRVIAAMPGLHLYRQLPVHHDNREIWPQDARLDCAMSEAEQYDGFVDMTFLNEAALGAFGKEVVPFSKGDNANAFVPGSEDFFCTPGFTTTFLDDITTSDTTPLKGRYGIMVLFRAREGVAVAEAQNFLWNSYFPAMAKAPQLRRLRCKTFGNVEELAHPRNYCASAELVFDSRLDMIAFFASDWFAAANDGFLAKIGGLNAFRLRDVLTLVHGGQLTTVGRYGPRLAQLIDDLGAKNIPQYHEEMDHKMTKRINITHQSVSEVECNHSRAVMVGDTIYFSGTTGFNYSTRQISADPVEQFKQMMSNVETALITAGSSLADIVQTTFLVTSAEITEQLIPLYAEMFKDIKPTTEWPVVALSAPAPCCIEICLTAVKGSGTSPATTLVVA